TSMSGWGVLISLLEAVVDRAADHLERVGTIVDDTSRQLFNPDRRSTSRRIRKKARNLQELVEKIGEEGDFNSKMRESLVSIGRLAAFMSAILEPVKQTREMKDHRSRIKILQRGIIFTAHQCT